MAQTPCRYKQDDETIPYTPNDDVAAGQVVVLGNCVFIAPHAIEAGEPGVLATKGLWWMPKTDGSVFARGEDVHWSAAASPKVGDASSGACQESGAGADLAGMCVLDALSTDASVLVLIRGLGLLVQGGWSEGWGAP